MQRRAIFLGCGDLQAVCVEDCRNQQGLHRERACIQRRLEFFVQYAFMGGMHVHYQQAALALG